MLKHFPELEPDDIQIAGAGATGEDMPLSPKARKILPLTIECKNVEKLNVWEAMKQAQSHSKNHFSALIFTRNRSPMYVAMPIEEFFELLKLKSLDKSL